MANDNSNIFKGIIIALSASAAGFIGYYLWKKSKETDKQKATPTEGAGATSDKSPSDSEIKLEPVTKGETQSTTPTSTQKCSEVVNLAGDKTYDYKKCDGVWFTRRKVNTTGQWISLAKNKVATDKLNMAFPKI